MNRFKSSILFLLFIAILCPLSAEQQTLPDPIDLDIGWWKEFEQSKENEGKIDALIKEIETLKAQLDSKSHPEVSLEIEQVVAAAQKVQKERKKEVEFQPIHPLYLTKYTLSDWLRVQERIREVQDRIHNRQTEAEMLQFRIDRLRNAMDYLQLAYPLKEPGTVEKLKTGLEIMSLRFQIASQELILSRLEKSAKLLDENLIKLKEEREIAYTRLDFSHLDQSEINQSLEKSQSLLLQANQKLLKSQKSEESDLSEILAANLQILLIKTEIAQEKIKLLIYQLEHDIPKQKIREQLGLVTEQLSFYEYSAKQIAAQLKLVSAQKFSPYEKAAELLVKLQAKISDTQLLLSILEDRVIVKEAGIQDYLILAANKITDAGSFLFQGLSIRLFRINDYPVTIWVILRAFLVLIGAILLSRITLRFLNSLNQLKMRIGKANTYILSRILFYLILILGAIAAAVSIGIDMTNFIIVAGALGVGVGLGLQAIVNNFFSGLVVLFAKILKVGDVIETQDDFKGVVKAIRMQNTHIRTFDGKDVVLPNADLVTKKVVNWTMADPYIRLHVPFGVEYGADKELVEKIVLEIANRFEFTMNDENICPKPKVWLSSLGDNALNMELVVWVNIRRYSSPGDMQTEYLWEIEKALLKAGIDIPFPQTDIRLIKVPEISLKQT